MRNGILVVVITAVSVLTGSWMFAAPALAGGTEVIKVPDKQAPQPDFAVLVEQARWLELLAATSQKSANNAADAQAVAYKLKAMRMLGHTDAALALADQALARFPGEPGLLLERAWIQAFKGDWTRALTDAQAAAAGKPELSDALIVQGIAYRETRDWDNALSAFAKAMELSPQNPVPSLNLGRAYVETRRWNEALVPLNRSIALAPDAPEAYVFRGQVYVGKGKLSEAMRDFNHALKLKPLLVAAYIGRGDVLARSGNWEAAAKDAYTAITLGTQDAQPYLTACQASVALGDWEALSGYAGAGHAIAPDNVDFLRYAGRAHRELGEPTKALAAYDQAVRIAPRDANLLLERATANVMMGRYDKAADDCGASLALKSSAMPYAMRAFARFKMGKLENAYEDATNALTLDPKTVTALLVKANIDLAHGKVSEALSQSRQALRLDPTLAWAYVTHGSALLNSGKKEEALRVLDQALSLTPDDGEAHLARGRTLAGLGRTSEARKDLEKAASLDEALAQNARDELAKLKP